MGSRPPRVGVLQEASFFLRFLGYDLQKVRTYDPTKKDAALPRSTNLSTCSTIFCTKRKKGMGTTVKVIYDRKRKAEKTGIGVVEALVCLTRTAKTYVVLGTMSPEAWHMCDPARDFAKQIKEFARVLRKMDENREELSVHNFNAHINRPSYNCKREKKYQLFIDFMRDAIIDDKLKDSTRHRKMLTLEVLIKYGKIQRFSDLSPENLKKFDEYLHDGTREDISVHTYHKHIRKYVRLAYELNYIPVDPYTMVHFPKGKSKERNPLTDEELDRVRELPLEGHLDKARDLFIFAAYTGLAYCDVEEFDFHTMAEHLDGMYYIDGRRIKTETNFFTPILPYAMDVLEKYNYSLPKISNQKVNDYLRIVASMANIRKKMTFHIARHSFATQALAHDIPIDKVARMLGHKDIKTTQIYAKVLKESVAKHANSWVEALTKSESNPSTPRAQQNKFSTPASEQTASVSQELPLEEPIIVRHHPKPVPQPKPSPQPEPTTSSPYYYPDYTSGFTYTYV